MQQVCQKKYKNIYERLGKAIDLELCKQMTFSQPNKCYIYGPEEKEKKKSLRIGIVKRVIHLKAEEPIWQSIIDEKNVYQIANEGDSCVYRYYCSWHSSEGPAKWSLVRLKKNTEKQMTKTEIDMT